MSGVNAMSLLQVPCEGVEPLSCPCHEHDVIAVLAPGYQGGAATGVGFIRRA